MDPENGCTLALAGSHLVTDALATQEERRRDFATENAVPLIAEAGDAYAIDSKSCTAAPKIGPTEIATYW